MVSDKVMVYLDSVNRTDSSEEPSHHPQSSRGTQIGYSQTFFLTMSHSSFISAMELFVYIDGPVCTFDVLVRHTMLKASSFSTCLD